LCIAAVLAHADLLATIPASLRLDLTWSIASVYTYAKWLLTTLALALAWRTLRQPLLLSLAGIFLVLLVDDSLKLHLWAGAALAAALELPGLPGLPAERLGKLLVWLVIGSACLAAFALGYARSGRAIRRRGHAFLLGIAGLALFGIVMDLLYALTYRLGFDFLGRAVRFAFVLVEEGGETVIASLLLALAVAIYRQAARPAGHAPDGFARPLATWVSRPRAGARDAGTAATGASRS
jgi:hypothetical protein